MTSYAYTAVPVSSAAGVPVKGTVDAVSESAVRAELRSKGMIAVSVRPERATDALRAVVSGDRPKRTDAAWFYETLYLMLDANVPVEQAVQSLADLAPSPRVASACNTVRDELRKGEPLARAVASVEGIASPHALALIRSGERSGQLAKAVGLIHDSMMRTARVRRAVTAQLIYPAVVLIAAVGAVWFLGAVVIPRFAITLESLGTELPWQTAFTLGASGIVVWLAPLLVVVAIAVVLTRDRWYQGMLRARVSKRLLTVPIFGGAIWNAQAALLTDVLATMLAGGADVLASLEQASDVLTNTELKRRLDAARKAVREGEDLGSALKRFEVLPPMANAVVAVGVRSGELSDGLARATDICATRQETTLQRLLALIGPAIILLLATVVGWVVYSLIVGMLAMSNFNG